MSPDSLAVHAPELGFPQQNPLEGEATLASLEVGTQEREGCHDSGNTDEPPFPGKPAKHIVQREWLVHGWPTCTDL